MGLSAAIVLPELMHILPCFQICFAREVAGPDTVTEVLAKIKLVFCWMNIETIKVQWKIVWRCFSLWLDAGLHPPASSFPANAKRYEFLGKGSSLNPLSGPTPRDAHLKDQAMSFAIWALAACWTWDGRTKTRAPNGRNLILSRGFNGQDKI